MSISTHILNASGHLSPYKNSIRKSARATIKKVRRKIKLGNIDILIKESERPEFLKDVNGVGGYCPSGHFVQLDIDIKHLSFRRSPQQIIEKTLIHELHHAARRQAKVRIFGGSFLESIFSEGLADHFVLELTGSLPIWTISLTKKDEEQLMKRAQREFKQKVTYKDYDDWFIIGSKKRNIPRWTGYALGFTLVENYLRNNPQRSAASLVAVPVGKIL